QTELKLALADLHEAGRSEPSLAAMLKTEGPLRDFIAAVLTLSPYLREIVNLDPAILAGAITQPLEPQIEALVAEARRCWQRDGEGAAPSESLMMRSLLITK
ncbi:bifunctional [glutamine synthetase] adenylyltransferase/[glutamine synthetase]-adenylyl-L-tyrosine phosphorylase, partial [Rhizobium ruizarguesonis]